MPRYVGALDQGTTSTRFMVFDAAGAEVARRQIEHTQIMPKPGWVEHDPVEIAARTNEVITGALRVANLEGKDLAAIGVTNQRETTVVWNPKTGRPWYNAIVWQDTRTDRIVNALRIEAPADLRTHGSAAGHLLLCHEAAVDSRERRRCAGPQPNAATRYSARSIRGSIWNLTGGADGGIHVTDVTNASRTLLMDLRTLDWDDELLALFGIPEGCCRRLPLHLHGTATA